METLFTLDLRSQSQVPLHRQVYEQIRAAILSGRLRSSHKLPASRQLAQSLSVSRTTIVQAYDQLMSEGYLETRPGAGTFVSAHIPDALLTATTVSAGNISDEISPPKDLSTSLSTYGQRLFTTAPPPKQTSARTQEALSFRYWRPDLSLFPIQQWQRLVNRHSLASTQWMTYDAEPMGYKPLREAIATYISHSRAVTCEPAQVLITQGTQQALGLIAQVLLNEGDAIALEDPGYLSARKVFSSYGAQPIPIPVDDQGLNVDALNRIGTAQSTHKTIPKLVYVTPSHQFPTGVLMSLPRRLALLAWAQQTGGLIVEDDYDSEYRYSGRPIPALQGLDTEQSVLYVGTFSKVMFPALRLGYMVLPPALIPVFRRAKWVCDRQCSLIHQSALAEFINEGHLAKHIRRMRTVYAQRRDCLVAALQTLGNVEILGDPAGLHVMARLPRNRRALHRGDAETSFIDKAAANGVSLFAVAPYYAPSAAESLPVTEQSQKQKNREREFIFGFGGLTETEIKDAIARIKPLFED